MNPKTKTIIDETRHWIDQVVIGLNLCPFAAQPWREDRVRIKVTDAARPEVLAQDLADALIALKNADPLICETTLLIHPNVLEDFVDYNDFLDVADQLVIQMQLDDEFQIASFHPDYCFADSAPGDRANATNRSPYPMLHLLRQRSVEAATQKLDHPEAIYERNIQTLRHLPDKEWCCLLKSLYGEKRPK